MVDVDEIPGPATEAGRRWREQLLAWVIPDEILEQAPCSPWGHQTAAFAVADDLDKDIVSAEVARTVLPPTSGSVLDIGCGGGRAALSLVPPAQKVIGVDESPAMLASFSDSAAAVGVRSMTIQGRWPDVAVDTPVADVVTCHHVAYNVAEIEPFIVSLTAHARLAVVLVLPVAHPMSCWSPAWQHFWGLERPTGPTSDDFIAVLDGLGIASERWEMPVPEHSSGDCDPVKRVQSAARLLCLGHDRLAELGVYLEQHGPPQVEAHTVVRWAGEV